MRTREITRKATNVRAAGNNFGHTIVKEFECPCGQGRIVEEHDDIPGHRHHQVDLVCTECQKKYIIDTSKGTQSWEVVPM